MGEMLSYWWLVVSRSWAATWTAVVERNLTAILRDLLLALVAWYCVVHLSPILAEIKHPYDANSSVLDWQVWAIAGLISVVALFAVCFLITALFITPYRIYLEQRAEIAVLRPPEKHPLDYTIRLTAADGGMPSTVLPEGMYVFHIRVDSVGQSRPVLPAGAQFPWGPPDLPSGIVRCTFENLGDARLLAIEADLEVLLHEVVPTINGGTQSGNVIGSVLIKSPQPTLPLGAEFSFFISNERLNYGRVCVPSTARIRCVGSEKWETVRLAPPAPHTYGVLYPFKSPSRA